MATIDPAPGDRAATEPCRPPVFVEIDKRARRALRLLESAASRAILSELGAGPLIVTELERRLPAFAPTTLRNHRRRLAESGALVCDERGDVSREVTLALTWSGNWLDTVRTVVMSWLRERPGGPIEIDGPEATTVIGALIRGWGAGVIQQLAQGPHRLCELEKTCNGNSKRELQTRLTALTQAGLSERVNGGGNRVEFALTRWGRLCVVPLAAAARWDHAHVPEQTTPMIPADVVAALALAVNLIELRSEDNGVCELNVKADPDADGEYWAAQFHVVIEQGKLVACAPRKAEAPTCWMTGSPAEWFDAIVERRSRLLRTGGERGLAQGIVRGLHRELVEGIARRIERKTLLASASACRR